MSADVPPLVDAPWLMARSGEPDLVVLEVGEDATAYYQQHLPGAGSLDWGEELQDPVCRGFVLAGSFAELMTAKGVRRDDHVVLYAADDPAYAAAAFWLLRYYRHTRTSLLDGGKGAWVAAGGLLAEAPAERTAGVRYPTPEPDTSIRATRDDILGRFVSAGPGRTLLDCRSPDEYRGHATHPLDMPLERHRVPGRIPGARNLPSTLLLDGSHTFRPWQQLRELFAERGIEPGDDVEVALYCRVAERSSLLWFVLHELLGHDRVLNYDGGWAEYGSLMHVPVER